MLLDYDPVRPLYVIGTGIVADEICHWIREEQAGISLIKISETDYVDLPNGSQCMLGFSNFSYRMKLLSNPIRNQHQWPSYVHPQAYVTSSASVSKGTVIQPMVAVGHEVRMGEFCLLTSFCHIGHGSRLGDHVLLYPGTMITGSVSVGNNVSFGQSTSVRDKTTIGNNIEFFMNSVVTKDILEPGTYYGNKKATTVL